MDKPNAGAGGAPEWYDEVAEARERLARIESRLDSYDRQQVDLDAARARRPPPDEPKLLGLTGRQFTLVAVALSLGIVFFSAACVTIVASGHGRALADAAAWLLKGSP
jgi:hypothetical protein